MKITDIETIILRMPEPVLPNGDNLQDILIIRVHTDEGITGIGEAHTSPTVLKAVIDAPISHLTTQGLKPLLIGKDPRRINELWELMVRHTASYGRRGVVMQAISGVDIALWDLLGKALGQPVHQLLGGKMRDSVPAYASDLSPATPQGMIEQAQRHAAAGFKGIKFGWGGLGGDVRADAKAVGEMRKALGPDIALMLDMGTPVPFDEAAWLARALAEHDVYFLEEPLSPDDLDGFSKLVAISPTPIATGEKETGRYGFRDLMERGDLRIIQPDVARCGGISEIRRIAALADVRNVRVIPHCWSTDILVAATLHFLATQRDAPWQEFNVMDNPLKKDLAEEPLKVVDGRVAVPDGPGLGIALNEEIIERYRWTPAR
jgi:L-alanine-DL-glutamate epimerase-like enolase superfamily enzyme